MKSEIFISKNHPACDGHFPRAPIVPGAVLLTEIASALGMANQPVFLNNAKFIRPVLPGTRLEVKAEPVTGGMKFELLLTDGTVAVSGTIRHDAGS